MTRLNIKLKRSSQKLVNADNLHRVAISNLGDQERALTRWWCNKYRTPPKPLEDYTLEEVFVEHLEDFYERDPRAAQSFLRSVRKEEDWDGNHAVEVERELQARWVKINRRKGIDPNKTLAKYQTESDKEMTTEDFNKIMASVGKNLPGSKTTRSFEDGSARMPGTPMNVSILGEDFEDQYGGGL
jgi:hypothetical protein